MGQTGEFAASSLIVRRAARMKYDYTQRGGDCKDVKREDLEKTKFVTGS